MTFHDRTRLIERLDRAFADDPGLSTALAASLRRAAQRRAELEEPLRDALEWPTDIAGYVDYLVRFARWIPQESGSPAWQDGAPRDRFAQEVSDRLAHFFWLVDQQVGPGDARVVEGSPVFRDFLSEFATAWGEFLDTPESFDREILDSFREHAPQYSIEESTIGDRPNAPSGWQTFNQFFARELNPGLRPIAAPGDNAVLVSPADCSYEHAFDIGADNTIPDTRLKQVKTYGDIGTLVEGSRYADAFAGGTFVHYMLPPSAYHRFHTPVAGRVAESFVNHGQVYMQVDARNGRLASLDRTDTGYEFFQTRGVLVLDTAAGAGGDVGLVGVVPVGMSHVASVVLSAQEGVNLAKGDEFGYFQFGGSDIVLLFQAGAEPEIDDSAGFRHVGSKAGRVRRRS